MKTNILCVAAAAIAASCAISCVNSNLDHPKAGTTIKVEEHSSLTGPELLKLDNETVAKAPNGDFLLTVPAKTGIEVAAPTITSTPTAITGSIELTDEGVPVLGKISAGAEFEAPAVVLTVENPYDTPISLTGRIKIDRDEKKIIDLPEAVIPAKSTVDVAYLKDADADADIKGDVNVLLPVSTIALVKAVPEIMTVENFKIAEHTGTKSVGTFATSTGKVKIGAAYKARMKYAKNSKIVISRSFKDLGFDLSEYVNVEATQYAVSINATNSIPADIDVAVSSEGYTATLDNPIKAGTVAAPVTTVAKLSVKAPYSAVSKLNDLDLTVTLTSASTFTLGENQKLDLDLESIHIDIVK